MTHQSLRDASVDSMDVADTCIDAGPDGLSEAEVAERVARGQTNDYAAPVSRTVEEIVRANVFTRFNLLVGSLVVVILVVGPIQDAVFGLVMIVNSAIGIIQELRAKRSLDRLALISAPAVTVVRGGRRQEIGAQDVVLGDRIWVKRGDQFVVDAVVAEADGLEVDESLLTGESEPCAKVAGARCLSGSAVLAGTGFVTATRVGGDSYAARVSREARQFELVSSELRTGTDRLLRWVGWAIVPTAAILIWSQIGASGTGPDAARGAVSGTVGMIPQGLVLLISMALAVGAARLARMNVLTQDLGALEGLARVDVVCFDKTGTITEGRLVLVGVVPIEGDVETAGRAMAAVAHADPAPNATTQAIASAVQRPTGWTARRFVPFRSDRRWSGAEFEAEGSWMLGAPDVLCAGHAQTARIVDQETSLGRRVLVLARTDQPLTVDRPSGVPVAVVVLGDAVRSDAAGTVTYFAEQDVALKMISGDHPSTVAAVARVAGIEGSSIMGSDLPTDLDELGAVAEATTLFGRIGPEQKRMLIKALQLKGHVVAMVGDGVNDVLALKAADVGVAMGSGSAAARSVSPVTLVDGRFARMPDIVAEGRRVIGNIERVASLYVTKTTYALLLAWAVGIAGWAFPLLPRHYTVIGVLTVGVPSFWLALEPSSVRARPGYIERVLRFGVPVGGITAMAGFAAFWVTRNEAVSHDEAQSITTLTLVIVGLAVLLLVARPLTPVRKLIIAMMAFGSCLVFVVPPLRSFYALGLPRLVVVLASVGITALTSALMYAALRASGWWRELPTALRQLEGLARPPRPHG